MRPYFEQNPNRTETSANKNKLIYAYIARTRLDLRSSWTSFDGSLSPAVLVAVAVSSLAKLSDDDGDCPQFEPETSIRTSVSVVDVKLRAFDCGVQGGLEHWVSCKTEDGANDRART